MVSVCVCASASACAGVQTYTASQLLVSLVVEDITLQNACVVFKYPDKHY